MDLMFFLRKWSCEVIHSDSWQKSENDVSLAQVGISLGTAATFKFGVFAVFLLSHFPVQIYDNNCHFEEFSQNRPRKNFKNEELKELSSSIKNQGLIQPIVVREVSKDSFEIIAGERRFRAAQAVGLKTVPVYIVNIKKKIV